jgi:hypothetical protein
LLSIAASTLLSFSPTHVWYIGARFAHRHDMLACYLQVLFHAFLAAE